MSRSFNLHNLVIKARRKLITPSLDKDFLQITQDAEQHESLFFNTLPKKKQQSSGALRANAINTTNVGPFIWQGNWSVLSRHSSNGWDEETIERRMLRRRGAPVLPLRGPATAQSKPRAPARQY